MSFGRILITGSSGFSGRHLSSYLLENYPNAEILGLDSAVRPPRTSIKFTSCDITDLDTLKKIILDFRPNTIFNLAGTYNQNDLPSLYNIHVAGTDNLMRSAMLLCRKVRIILASSAAVYGAISPENNPITEEVPFNPVSHHGISKVCMEMVAHLYGQAQDELQIIIARTFNLIGAGISSALLPGRLSTIIGSSASSGGIREIRVGNTNTIRDFVSVKDAVEAYTLLAIRGKKNNAYNIGSSTGTKIRDLITLFVEKANSNIQVISDPSLYKTHDPEMIVADTCKIRRNIGWKPNISLAQTIDDMLSSKLDM